jgi:hypothetical protein
MTTYFYSETDEQIIEQLDKEFRVVTVIGDPEDGYSGGYDLVIIDNRSKSEIASIVRNIYKRKSHIA